MTRHLILLKAFKISNTKTVYLKTQRSEINSLNRIKSLFNIHENIVLRGRPSMTPTCITIKNPNLRKYLKLHKKSLLSFAWRRD